MKGRGSVSEGGGGLPNRTSVLTSSGGYCSGGSINFQYYDILCVVVYFNILNRCVLFSTTSEGTPGERVLAESICHCHC